jgi:CheY-like chemotaxis protein
VKLLRLILKDAGYRVLEAGSGPEALDILRWNPNRRPP